MARVVRSVVPWPVLLPARGPGYSSPVARWPSLTRLPTRSAPRAALLPPSSLMPRTSRRWTPVSMRWLSRSAPSISRSTLSPTEMSSSHLRCSRWRISFGQSGPHTLPGLGGFKIALDALEGLRRQWACELGQHGIRVVTIKTGGVPESMYASVAMRDEITAAIEQSTLLKRAAQLSDVGNVAAFVASDQARTMTASTVNISCGALMDY